MTLESGTRLSHYEIVELRGKGGMGEVYRAHDTRLERDVAIKVLPAELSQDQTYRSRLEREAKTISQLQHPHVCTLYDVGSEDGVDYLVMEYLEGETLEERLGAGPLSTRQALRIGAEVAEALAAAHSRGIVHRDLKPGNVMLTEAGAKVLDFGLAKGLEASPVGPDTHSPTMTEPLTREGSFTGTLHYMAPEQLEGAEADARSDIWALGCVLFELAVGSRPFVGDSQVGLIGAILKDEPRTLEIEGATGMRLAWLVDRCLEKRPDRRWQSAHDVRIELERIREEGSSSSPIVPTIGAGTGDRGESSNRLQIRATLLLMIGLAVGGLGAWLLFGRDEPEVLTGARPSVRRYTLHLPDELPFFSFEASAGALAISRDGLRLVYETPHEHSVRLASYRFDTQEFSVVEGSEGAVSPALSPDARSIVYFSMGKLAIERLSLEGGRPVLLAPFLGVASSFDWRRDGFIYVTTNQGAFRLPESGGRVEALSSIASRGELKLAGGAVFSSLTGPDRLDLYAWETGAGAARLLIDRAQVLQATLSGHLLLRRSGEDRLEAAALVGEPLGLGTMVDVTEPWMAGGEAVDQLALSEDGTLVYPPIDWDTSSNVNRSHELVIIDRDGTEESLGLLVPGHDWARLSEDGSRVAFSRFVAAEGSQDLWIHELGRGSTVRFTANPETEGLPLFTPDGNELAFTRRPQSHNNLHIQSLERSEPARRLVTREVHDGPIDFTSDGRHLTFIEYGNEDGFGVMLLDLDDGSVTPLVQTSYTERGGELSPDDRWMAYDSDETGRFEVYLRPFPDVASRRIRVTLDGGERPVWNPRGGELFFGRGGALYAVSVSTDPEPEIGEPTKLFEGPYQVSGGGTYDVFPDGQRFLVAKRSLEREPVHELQVVENWLEEVKRRVPLD